MSTLPFTIQNYFEAHAQVAQRCDAVAFDQGVELVVNTFRRGKKVITCGNGGSASTASHYITDWVKMGHLASGERHRGLSLCDNLGIITAYGNDMSYDDIFVGQLRALMDEGDLLICVSGSGNSRNVLAAAEYANTLGETLAVVGYDGGKLMPLCRHAVWVPSFDMQICEDMHLMFGHMVMKALCGQTISIRGGEPSANARG